MTRSSSTNFPDEHPKDPERLLPEEEDTVESTPGEVPAGGAGADSGAAESVRVDHDDEASIPDRSTHNVEPGVGTRRAER